MIVDVAREIKNAVSMTDVCERYGIEVNSAGYAVCPFHAEKTGSLKVYPGRRGWHCFGCGEGGDVLDFVRRYFDLDLREAEAKLNDDFSLGILMGATDYRTRLKAGRIAAERRKAAEEKRRQSEQLDAEYWAAHDYWLGIRRTVEEKRPATPEGVPSAEWLDALGKISGAELRLEEAEARRMRWLQREK